MANALNKLIAYFDLQAQRRGKGSLVGTEGAPGPTLTVFLQYVALALGIWVEPLLKKFQATGAWSLDAATSLNWFLFALVAAMLVFPSVYRRSFDQGQPRFVQFCVIFVSGIGWKSLFAAVVKV